MLIMWHFLHNFFLSCLCILLIYLKNVCFGYSALLLVVLFLYFVANMLFVREKTNFDDGWTFETRKMYEYLSNILVRVDQRSKIFPSEFENQIATGCVEVVQMSGYLPEACSIKLSRDHCLFSWHRSFGFSKVSQDDGNLFSTLTEMHLLLFYTQLFHIVPYWLLCQELKWICGLSQSPYLVCFFQVFQ